MSDYDVIIVGAGNGGLSAAVGLAQRDIRVLLLERHNVPGGCATSFVRGRFEFEVALHQLSGLGTVDNPGPLHGLLGSLEVLDKIDFVQEAHLYRTVVPGKFDFAVKANREEMIRDLSARFPKESGAIEKFMALVYQFCMEYIGAVYLTDPESSKEKYPLYFKYALVDSGKVLDDFFEDPYLKLTLGSYWGYVGLPPSKMSFADLAFLLWAYLEYKPFHIKGGSQAMSSAFMDAFLQAGGEVQFCCGVEKIIVSEGAVKGVITEHGDEISADYIVSNAGTLKTYVDLIDREFVPPEHFTTLSRSTIGPSAFTVYLGLDCEPGDLGIDISTSFITTNEDCDSQFASWKTLDKPQMTGFTCYDVADPEFSPAGACQVVLINLQYLDHWLTIPPHRYAETKYQYAQHMIDIAEQVYPGFTSYIEELEVATPLTHLRYLGHPGGAIYGTDQYAKDSKLFVSPKSSIDGLYFSGAWAGMGGFQPTLESGVTVAKAIYKLIKEDRGEDDYSGR